MQRAPFTSALFRAFRAGHTGTDHTRTGTVAARSAHPSAPDARPGIDRWVGGWMALSGLLLALTIPAGVRAACLDDEAVAQWAAHYEARTPAANPPADMTAADAACTRARLQAALAPKLGKPVGYKAGLTNPAVQKRFNTDQPVWGVCTRPIWWRAAPPCR